MKNKEFRTLMAIVTLTGTLLTGLTAGAAPVYAADTDTATATTSTMELASDTTARPYKDETVYATIDGNGSVTSVTVSDQLKNISDTASITDQSDLQNIENIKGDETFTTKDGKLTWNTNDADICYQGTSSKALPVGVKVTYTLDGQQMNAGELTGKSGHLVIRYTYENNSASETGEITPFLMATGLMLDSETFKNITVTNGRLLSDGEKDIAVGLGVPALSDMLGTDTLDIPDYFEVEADVTEYTPAEGMTIATNSLFNDLSTDKFDSLSDLQGAMNQLQSASSQLVDGSGQLRTGLDTLLASSGTLTDGISQLASGSTTLASGTKALKSGADELSGGLSTASSKVSGELLPGIKALDNGVAQMQGSLSEGLPALANGISALDNGITQIADGTKALSGGISQVADGTTALNTGIQTLGQNTSVLDSKVQELGTAIGNLNSVLNPAQAAGGTVSIQADTLNTDASALASGLHAAASQAGQAAPVTFSAGAGTDSNDEILILQNLLDSGTITDGAAIASIEGVIQTLSAEQSVRDNAAPVSIDNSALQNTLTTLASQADTLAGNTQTLTTQIAASSNVALMQQLAAAIGELNSKVNGDGGLVDSVGLLNAAVNTGSPDSPALTAASARLDAVLNTGTGTTPSIKAAAAKLDAALNTGDPANNVSSLRSGASQLNAAVNGENGLTTQVSNGVSQLKSGTSQLVAGVDGENGLAAGLNLLDNGALRLASGSSDLNTGANALANGIHTLQDGSGALIDGVQKLDDGAVKLNDGMIQFDEEGIQKLVNAFGGDVESLLDKANTMLNTSRSYRNFSGISDDMDGEVKFVFISE